MIYIYILYHYTTSLDKYGDAVGFPFFDKLRRSKGLHPGVSLGGAWSSIFEYAYAYTFASYA
jgi:hypothetical protein